MANLDYKIAEDYLNRLSDEQKVELCTRTLGGVENVKKTLINSKKKEKELKAYFNDYLDRKYPNKLILKTKSK